jgi:hypothetical protein
MKMISLGSVVLLLIGAVACQSQKEPDVVEIPVDSEVKEYVKQLIAEPEDIRILAHPIIKDQKTAVAVAEILATAAFGTEIKQERPYQVALVDGRWVVTGSLREGHIGGVFEVIMDAEDGRILRLSHGE